MLPVITVCWAISVDLFFLRALEVVSNNRRMGFIILKCPYFQCSESTQSLKPVFRVAGRVFICGSALPCFCNIVMGRFPKMGVPRK